MDDATTSTDIRLREGASIAQRLVMAGFAAAVALCFTPGLFTHDIVEVIISTLALLVGAGFVVGIMMAPAVVWIITPDEIDALFDRLSRALDRTRDWIRSEGLGAAA